MVRVSTPADETSIADEAYRLHVLHSLGLLDTPPESDFDTLVNLAKDMFGCPIALVSLVDEERQWFKARCGLDATETPRDMAFCAHAIQSGDAMIVADTADDVRFATNPLVTGPPYLRFYAGVPIKAAAAPREAAVPLGTLCVLDTVPRQFTALDILNLGRLGELAEAIIRCRRDVGGVLSHATERNATAMRLSREHRQLAQAERMAGFGSWRLSIADEQIEWSDQVFAIHDLPVGQLPELHRALEFFPPHSRAALSDAVAAAIEHGTPYDLELDFISATGRERRVRSIGEAEIVDGTPVALIGVFQDVTERYHIEQRLRRSAHQDELTGIANRAGFNLALQDAIDNAPPLTLMLIDLDGFKQVNDTHGHIAGDELLQGIARRLDSADFGHCIAARLGGDEFALIVTDPVGCADASVLADRVLAVLRQPVATGSGSLAVAGTIGICAFAAGMDRRDLIHCADMALYDAKRAGKGIARTWQASLDSHTQRRVGERRR